MHRRDPETALPEIAAQATGRALTGEVQVDILMATYNGREFIDLQIASILAQSHQAIRILIRDDKSSDGTAERLDHWAGVDRRVRVVRDDEGRLNTAGNFLSLLLQSTAPYVMFADQDDVWMSSKVARSLDALNSAQSYDADIPTLVVCDALSFEEGIGLVSSSTQRARPHQLEDFIFLNGGFYGCCMLFNRRLAAVVINHPVDFCAQHDHLISLVALTLGKVIHLDERLMFYRRHTSNLSGGPASLARKVVRFMTGRQPIVSLQLCRAVESFVRAFGPHLSAADKHTFKEYLAFPKQSRLTNALMVIRHPFRIYGTRLLLLSKLLHRPLT